MYCQVCGLKNPDEEEYCGRCNSKLLVLSGVGLVEETGATTTGTGGRPAKLYRFRREIVLERAVAGSKLPLARS